MLIPFENIVKKYKLNIDNILHVGAHTAEELQTYLNCGVSYIIWVEANREVYNWLKSNIPHKKSLFVCEVVADVDDKQVNFNITNNYQSSSILELGTHKQLFPQIHVNSTEVRTTKTINTIFKENKWKISGIDFINLDIQGAELQALQGINDNLKYIKSIYTEINTEEVYKGCALMSQIDEYLQKYDFKRVETKMWQDCHPWGDAFYIKDI